MSLDKQIDEKMDVLIDALVAERGHAFALGFISAMCQSFICRTATDSQKQEFISRLDFGMTRYEDFR